MLQWCEAVVIDDPLYDFPCQIDWGCFLVGLVLSFEERLGCFSGVETIADGNYRQLALGIKIRHFIISAYLVSILVTSIALDVGVVVLLAVYYDGRVVVSFAIMLGSRVKPELGFLGFSLFFLLVGWAVMGADTSGSLNKEFIQVLDLTLVIGDTVFVLIYLLQ